MHFVGLSVRCLLPLVGGLLGDLAACQEPKGSGREMCRAWIDVLCDAGAAQEQRARARQGLVRSGAVAAQVLLKAVARSDDAALHRELFALVERIGPGAAEPMIEYVVSLRALPEGALTEFAGACLHTVPFSDRFWSDPWPAPSRMLPAAPAVLPGRRGRGQASRSKGASELEQVDQWLARLAKTQKDPRELSVVLANVREPSFRYEEFWLRALVFHGVAARELLPWLAKRVAFPVPKGVLPLEKLRYLEICDAMLAVDPAAADSAVAHAYFMVYHPNPDRRRRAAMELGRCGGGRPRQVVPQLLFVLRAGDLALRREAVTALGFYGAAAEVGLDEVRSLAAHDDPELAARAKATLRHLEK